MLENNNNNIKMSQLTGFPHPACYIYRLYFPTYFSILLQEADCDN